MKNGGEEIKKLLMPFFNSIKAKSKRMRENLLGIKEVVYEKMPIVLSNEETESSIFDKFLSFFPYQKKSD